jgi:hypothetical protein
VTLTLEGYDFSKPLTINRALKRSGRNGRPWELAIKRTVVIHKNRRKAAKFATMTFAYRGSIVFYFMGNALHTQAAAVRADGGTTSGHYTVLSFLHRKQNNSFL